MARLSRFDGRVAGAARHRLFHFERPQGWAPSPTLAKRAIGSLTSVAPAIGATMCVVLLYAPLAQGALGGNATTLREDHRRIGGEWHLHASAQFQVHEVTLPDGGAIRQFVAPDGTVFAVAWNTRLKPNLEILLGQRYADFQAAAAEVNKRPGIKRSLALRHRDVVVHSISHLNAFVGRAYAPSLVPGGVNLDEIR
jgi:hypothetical protein